MGLGGYNKKLVASAKLGHMEKYGFCYNEDINLIKDVMADEIQVDDDQSGTVVVHYNGREFKVTVRNYIKQGSLKQKRDVQPDEDRKGWVSIWDPTNH